MTMQVDELVGRALKSSFSAAGKAVFQMEEEGFASLTFDDFFVHITMNGFEEIVSVGVTNIHTNEEIDPKTVTLNADCAVILNKIL